MRLGLKQFLIRFHTWIILSVIMFFGFASFFTSLKILEEEGRAVLDFKAKLEKLAGLDQEFHELEEMVEQYFLEIIQENSQDRVDEISEAFSNFQQEFIYFNHLNADNILPFHAKEMTIVNIIQTDLSSLIPFIQDHKVNNVIGIPPQVKETFKKIDDKMHEFEKFQISDERAFLSQDMMNDRRQRIFIAISILGLSGCFLILFLVYKNNKLEESQAEHQKVFDLAELRIRAIEASKDGIGIMDKDRRLIYMNDALAELHGIPLSEKDSYIGNSWTGLYNDIGRAQIEKNVYPVLDSLGEWRGESKVMRKDGAIIDAELSLTMLPDHNGMIGTARDVTARREAEDEKKSLQSQVHQAQKMEAVGRLAGGIAHDFNNILSAIMGYAEFLSEDLEKEKHLKKFADNILLAGQKARGLIDQMLSFSRRRETQRELIDLDNVLEETLSMITPALPKTIELAVNRHLKGPAYVNGDSGLLIQGIMNIIVNASDAMEGEKGRLEISLNLVEPDEESYEGMLQDDIRPDLKTLPINIQEVDVGHLNLELGTLKRGVKYFQISISDTGMGMSRSVMEHIFEPFFTTKPVDKGTGLGMANVHGSILAHQAAMIIDSVLMEGTTFDIYLPQADHIGDITLLSQNYGDASYVDLSNVRALVVDDQEEVLMMVTTMLKRTGIETISFNSSLRALEYLREAHDAFDIVVTDQNMPNMTGLELVEQVQQLNPNLPFIILSGYSNEKLEEIRGAYPMIRECIRKPAKKEILIGAIKSILKQTL